MEWENYIKSIDPEGKSASLAIKMKWSLWSANPATWEEEAPIVIRHLRSMQDNVLHLTLKCEKEYRYGEMTIRGTSDSESEPGLLFAKGRMWTLWDDVDELIETLDLKSDCDITLFRESLPFTQTGQVGVEVNFCVSATSVIGLLGLIDEYEVQLIQNTEDAWNAIEKFFLKA
jgi:hypothetical protein